MRYTLDSTWSRFGNVVLAGSPLRLFRTTAAAEATLDALERDGEVRSNSLVRRFVEAGAIHPRVTSAHPAAERRREVTVVTPQLGGTAATDGRIVIDDGSEPPIDGATVRLPDNAGPAAARNAARPLIDTEFVAFVDADVDLGDGVGIGSWLDALLPHFDDPEVGLVAPRVLGEADSPLDLGDEPARIRAGTRVSYVPAAAIVVRVAAFDDVGGFDESLRYGEDVDFVWRLDGAGWRCRYEPDSCVWHEPRHGTVARLRQHALYGSAAAPLALRHPRSVAPYQGNPWSTAGWGLLVAGHPVVALSVAGASTATLVARLRDVPTGHLLGLAGRGHLAAGRQLAHAIRRVWWPLVAVGALLSRRLRLVALISVAASPWTAATDVAYGWGVWTGMVRRRTIRPLAPSISTWPGRATGSR